MVVIGGVAARVGPIVGALWVIGLPALFPDNELVPLFTSSLGLLIVVMYFPGGLAQIGYLVRNTVDEWAVRRLPPAAEQAVERPVVTAWCRVASLNVVSALPMLGRDVLRVEHISVRFGGNVAVARRQPAGRDGEIVGLIGTNGAGKSTLLNAIGGYVPSKGSVELLGRDVIAWE